MSNLEVLSFIENIVSICTTAGESKATFSKGEITEKMYEVENKGFQFKLATYKVILGEYMNSDQLSYLDDIISKSLDLGELQSDFESNGISEKRFKKYKKALRSTIDKIIDFIMNEF